MEWFTRKFIKVCRKLADKGRAEAVAGQLSGKSTQEEVRKLNTLSTQLDAKLDIIEERLNAKV